MREDMAWPLGRVAPFLLGALFLLSPALASGQAPADPRPEPTDTYADPEVRELLQFARGARNRIAEGLLSYEARMWERTYIGIDGPAFRRERGLVEDERVARVRWEREGIRTVRWEGYRRDSDVLSAVSVTPESVSVGIGGDSGAQLLNELSGDGRGRAGPRIPLPLTFDPGSDELAFGPNVLLNPLADSAVHHYRYQSGDTIRLTLPGGAQRILLAEVLVEPRRSDFQLVSASLWFDLSDGSLVRAGYRPARPFDVSMDLPENDRPPGIIGPVRAEISYVTIESGLYDLRWWVPRRYSFDGEIQLGFIANVPATIEWTVDDITVNGPRTIVPEVIPEGWRLREAEVRRNDRTLNVTVLVPTIEELVNSPELSDRAAPIPEAFTEEELGGLRRRLLSLAAPMSFAAINVDWGLGSRMTRYNRVEALSTGVSLDLPLPSLLSLHAEARVGVADWSPRGELRLSRTVRGADAHLAVFRRLDSSSEWANPHDLTSSLGTLIWGDEVTPYHQSWGAELAAARTGGRLRVGGRLFVERQDAAERNTHVHLARLWNDEDLPLNPPSTEGVWQGAAANLRWNLGQDPLGLRAFGRFELEGATGESGYGRGWSSLGLGATLLGVSAVAEGGVGTTTGTLPLQRRFFPGGATAYRGLTPGEVAGEAFWFGRAELGRATPGARLVGFVDWLAVGPRASLWEVNPLVAVGGGFSVLDGLVRFDIARNLRGAEDWRFIFYLDGLF